MEEDSTAAVEKGICWSALLPFSMFTNSSKERDKVLLGLDFSLSFVFLKKKKKKS